MVPGRRGFLSGLIGGASALILARKDAGASLDFVPAPQPSVIPLKGGTYLASGVNITGGCEACGAMGYYSVAAPVDGPLEGTCLSCGKVTRI